MERSHHSRVICPGIVADGDDEFTAVKVLQRHRAFADSDRLWQADAGGFVAHVRAIREIVRSIFPCEQLEEVSRLVRCPAGRIEVDLVGRQATKDFTDPGERHTPIDGPVRVSGTIVDQRVGKAAHVLQLKI